MDQMDFMSYVVLAASAFWIGLAAWRGLLSLRKMPAMMLVAFLALSGVVAVIGDKTNGLMRVIGSLWSPPPAMVTVTETDIARGWHRIKKECATIGYWRDRYADYAEYQNTNSLPLLIGGRTDLYLQERHIDEDGVFRTDKFGHWISRSKSCRIILDGDTIQWWHH